MNFQVGQAVYVSTKGGFLPGHISEVVDNGYGRYYTVRFSDAGEGTFHEDSITLPQSKHCICGVTIANVGGFHSDWCDVGNL